MLPGWPVPRRTPERPMNLYLYVIDGSQGLLDNPVDWMDSLFTLGETLGAPVEVVSRSDSTLRGHVLAEMQAIDAARRRVTGTGFDGVLLVARLLRGRPVYRR